MHRKIFSLKDLNPSSEYFNEFIGPSYFSNNIVIIYFGHGIEVRVGAGLAFLNSVHMDLLSMNIYDVKIIGVGKDEYGDHLNGMIEGKSLPWVTDSSDNSYPVWEIFGATQVLTF